LGTRKSPLALAQSGMVARELEATHPGLVVELVPMTTEGDRVAGDLTQVGGKGLFTAELEAGLVDGSLDLAVHSLKDLPCRCAPSWSSPRTRGAPTRATCWSARWRRASPACRPARSCSRGRFAVARNCSPCAPDLDVEGVRGNVGTRLRKWRERDAAATVLAAAGLARLGVEGVPAHPLSPDEMLPAPGQGILALQVRRGAPAEAIVAALDDPATAAAARAERAVVAAFGGDCTLPLAAWARQEGVELVLDALLAAVDGSEVARATARGRDPEAVAAAVVAELRARGAERVLATVRSAT
jgi:hydroxymethylbilane synthase